MKRLVICYDGTWNSVTDPSAVTNVVRLGQAVKKVGKGDVPQVVYYNAGVGSGGPLDRFLGGVFGVGLRANVKRGLAFLTLNWNPESEEGPADEIYIFGFSRGAYSARALAGVIAAIEGIPKQEHFDKLERIWNYYRTDPGKRDQKMKDDIRGFIHWRPMGDDASGTAGATQPIIKCLGVWDTVGSYGVPSGLGLGALARSVTSWTRGFHDNTIGPHVEYAFHAMSIDERRRAFPETAWIIEKGMERKNVEQVWFAGSHSNIGGGYRRSGLADLALIWMIARVNEETGLDFDEGYVGEHFWPCAACSLYNSDRGWVLSSLRPYLRPVLDDRFPGEVLDQRKKVRRTMQRLNEKVHWSVIERLGRMAIVDESRNRKYAPSNLPKNLPNDRAPNAFEDERVAKKTEVEARLIKACRDAHNDRMEHCALSCEVKTGASRGIFDYLRNMWSAERRREQRVARLQDIWNMKKAASPGPR